ncbi:hypothetical protein [Pseudomonas sp. NPDC089401]
MADKRPGVTRKPVRDVTRFPQMHPDTLKRGKSGKGGKGSRGK